MPYNPGISYDARPLAAGIASLGQSIGAAIEKRKEEKKRRAQEFDGLTKYGVAAGLVDADEAKTMSLDQLSGHIKAQVWKQEQERARTRDQQYRELVAEQIRAARGANAQRESMAGLGRDLGARMEVAENLSRTPGFEGVPAPQFSELLRESLGKNPGAMSVDMVEAIARYRQSEKEQAGKAEGDGRAKPVTTPEGRVIGYEYGNRWADAKDPLLMGTRGMAEEVKTKDGRVIGYMVGGDFKPSKDLDAIPDDAVYSRVRADDGSVVPGLFVWRSAREKKSGQYEEPSMSPLAAFLQNRLGGAGAPGPVGGGGKTDPADPLGLGLGKR